MLRIESLVRLMSTRTLCVYLSPQRVCAVVRQRRATVAGSARQMPVADGHSDGHAHWQPAVDALNGLLRQHAAEWAGLPLQIALAGRWSQLALAPWSDALLSASTAASFLQMQLLALYGDAALSWRISADDAPYGHSRLVCGVDELLPQALEASAAEHGHPCRMIEPMLGAALSASPPAAPKALIVAEAGRLTMAALQRGRVSALQIQPAGPAWPLELPLAWQRWTLRVPELAALERVTVLPLCPGAAQAALPARFQLSPHPYDADAPSSAPPSSSAREVAA